MSQKWIRYPLVCLSRWIQLSRRPNPIPVVTQPNLPMLWKRRSNQLMIAWWNQAISALACAVRYSLHRFSPFTINLSQLTVKISIDAVPLDLITHLNNRESQCICKWFLEEVRGTTNQLEHFKVFLMLSLAPLCQFFRNHPLYCISVFMKYSTYFPDEDC